MHKEERIIDYINGELSKQDAIAVRELIETDEEAKAIYLDYKDLKDEVIVAPLMTPDADWVASMTETLKQTTVDEAKVVKMSSRGLYSKIAVAAATFFIGLIGYNMYVQNQSLNHVADELYVMRQVLQDDQNQSSVSSRIKAVRYGGSIDTQDEDFISVLAHTMTTDKSAHVRLAAVEALRNWTDLSHIKSTMIDALKSESDPSVKILLIEILSSTKDSDVGPHLDDLINDVEQPQYIKDEAHKGMFLVSNKQTVL